MDCKELRITLNKFALSKRQLSTLLNYDYSYLASMVSREQEETKIPTHIETIVNLLFCLKIRDIDYISVLEEIYLGSNTINNNFKEDSL